MTRACATLPGGVNVLTTRISDNCIEPLVIDVDHGDGTVVEIDVATCLAWNGHSNPPTHMAVTAAQAGYAQAGASTGYTHVGTSAGTYRGRVAGELSEAGLPHSPGQARHRDPGNGRRQALGHLSLARPRHRRLALLGLTASSRWPSYSTCPRVW